MPDILDDNLACLRQGLNLLDELDDQAYSEKLPHCHNSSIGGHFRHNIDHYRCFLRGLASGTVDYDARARQSQLEESVEAARTALSQLVTELEALRETNWAQPLRVVMDSGEARPLPTSSSAGRELQFLLSHTIHHYALVATIRQLQGFSTPPQFGVAPSTCKHQLAG